MDLCRFNQLGIDFVQGYGLTEASAVVTLNPTERYKIRSVGRVIEGVRVRITRTACISLATPSR